MINKAYKLAATALASCALLSPHAAMAQQCVEEADLADAVVYFTPIAYSAFSTKCGPALADGGFVKMHGEEFIAPYVARQDEAWAGAFRVFKVFADGKKSADQDGEPDEMAAMFDALPPEALRPFLGAVIEMEIAKEIKLESCEDVERLLAPLVPLPPENLGALAAVIVGMVPDIKDPQVCPAKPQ